MGKKNLNDMGHFGKWNDCKKNRTSIFGSILSFEMPHEFLHFIM
jgi:hypothetical protein